MLVAIDIFHGYKMGQRGEEWRPGDWESILLGATHWSGTTLKWVICSDLDGWVRALHWANTQCIQGAEHSRSRFWLWVSCWSSRRWASGITGVGLYTFGINTQRMGFNGNTQVIFKRVKQHSFLWNQWYQVITIITLLSIITTLHLLFIEHLLWAGSYTSFLYLLSCPFFTTAQKYRFYFLYSTNAEI